MLDESDHEKAEGMNFTHRPEKLKVPYHQLHKNPDPKDNSPSYAVHEIHEGAIGNNEKFSKNLINGYRLSFIDKLQIWKVYKKLEKRKEKGSDPTLDGAHIISPQDNTKGSSAHPSSGKGPKGGKTMGRKAKKAGVAALAVVAVSAGAVAVGVLIHQKKIDVGYLQAVTVKNLWKVDGTSGLTADQKLRYAIGEDGSITLKKAEGESDAPAPIKSDRSIGLKKGQDLRFFVTMKTDQKTGQPISLEDSAGNAALNVTLDPAKHRSGGNGVLAGFHFGTCSADGEYRAKISFQNEDIAISNIGLYDLSPIGYADTAETEYIWNHLTDGKAYGGDFIFSRGEINKLAKKYDGEKPAEVTFRLNSAAAEPLTTKPSYKATDSEHAPHVTVTEGAEYEIGYINTADFTSVGKDAPSTPGEYRITVDVKEANGFRPASFSLDYTVTAAE